MGRDSALKSHFPWRLRCFPAQVVHLCPEVFYLSAPLEPLYPGSKLAATTWCLYRSGALINQPESNLTQAHRKKLRGSVPWDILNRQHKPVLPPSHAVLYVPFPSFLPKPSGLHTRGKTRSPSGPESSTRTAGGWPSRFTSCCINRGAWAHRP